jgi:hypothetical protein
MPTSKRFDKNPIGSIVQVSSSHFPMTSSWNKDICGRLGFGAFGCQKSCISCTACIDSFIMEGAKEPVAAAERFEGV